MQTERADQPGRAGDRARVAALSRVREQEEEPGLLDRVGGEDPRCPDGLPGLRIRRVELHVRAVRRRPIPLQRVHERVDLLRDDRAELDEPRRVAEPPLEVGAPEGLHAANVRVSFWPCSCATRPRKPPFAPTCARGSRSTTPASTASPDTRREGLEPPDLRRGLRRADVAGGVRRAGRPNSEQAILYEEWARAEAPSHLGVIGLGMAGPTIIAHGTEEQKQRYLANILSGEEIWCQGFSEPGAGSDLSAVRTSAELRDGHFVVTGQKIWSSYAHIADWCILITRSDPESQRHAGLTYMVVDMHSPGVEVRPIRHITGDADFNEIFFEDVEVPVENVLDEIGNGWAVAMTTLLHERGTLGFALTGSLEVLVTSSSAWPRSARCATRGSATWSRASGSSSRRSSSRTTAR